MHWKKCYILTLLKRETGIAIEDLFSFITDIPMLISENSNSTFSLYLKVTLAISNLAQALHRLSTVPITRATSTVTYGRYCHWYCQKSKQIFFKA